MHRSLGVSPLSSTLTDKLASLSARTQQSLIAQLNVLFCILKILASISILPCWLPPSSFSLLFGGPACELLVLLLSFTTLSCLLLSVLRLLRHLLVSSELSPYSLSETTPGRGVHEGLMEEKRRQEDQLQNCF